MLRAAPDGYTVLCAPQLTFSVSASVVLRPRFDTRGLEPVSVLATYPLVLLGRAGLPANNLAELLAYARANPGKINYGHQGKGNTGHLLGELLMLKGGFRMTEIPYRGSAPAINDLLGRDDRSRSRLSARQQAEHRRRQAQAPRRRQPRAAQGLSERRDHRGDTARRLCGHLDGSRCASGNAEGGRQEALGRDRTGISGRPS